MTPPSDLESMPTSCEVVWRVLHEDAPLTTAEISDQTTCSDVTIRRAVRRLYDAGMLEARPTSDGRSVAYSLA